MTNNILSIHSVTKSFEDQAVLNDFHLDIAQGEFITLLGPSGCGKTTLLRIIAGFEKPDRGTILLNGTDIVPLPPEQRQVNTVFQSYALFPHLSVFENVAFGLRLKGLKKKEIENQVLTTLDQVKMKAFAHRFPGHLSGGQQQRIAMARAIVNHPKVLLLDEPLSALDARLRRTMQIELKRLQRDLNIAFVFVTHDQDEALSMSDRVVVMQEGEIAQIGTPREVYEEPNNLYVARFIGDINLFPGTIRDCQTPGILELDIFNTRIRTTTSRSFHRGQKIQLLLRPEDIRVSEEIKEGMPRFSGTIIERSYRGSTLDTTISLDLGPIVNACEFFDEDDPDFDYRVGERVTVSWVPGWEVVLADD